MSDIERALTNLVEYVEGDGEPNTATYDEAMEKGLTPTQKEVAERYADEGPVEVQDERVPSLGDKLAAGSKIPWTFVLDNVEFIKKTSIGSGSTTYDSEWWWREDGYRFTYYRRKDGVSRVSIKTVDDPDPSSTEMEGSR